MFGVGEDSEDDESDAEAMGVICYDLGSTLKTMK
jgi:hypothetical protein